MKKKIVPHKPGGKREEKLEEKLKPGLHKKVKAIFKKKHPGKKMTHHEEQILEEKVAHGIHKKVEKVAKKASKRKDPKPKTKGKSKIEKVMKEFKAGKLHSGSKKGPEVTNPKQAIAIALNESRRAGAKIRRKKNK